MALRTTRGQLVEMVRNECGISSDSSRGNDNLGYLHQLINRHYEMLCDDFDWTFLRVDNDDATKALQAGSRYYDFPVEMDFEKTVTAWGFQGNIWIPLDYGISMADYNQMNPELDQRSDPVLKWRAKDGRQFEVWPLPASDGDIATVSGPLVRFTGRRQPERLTSNSSRADMDDILIVLNCAAEILAKKSQKDAEAKLAAARKRLSDMRAGYADRGRCIVGSGENPNNLRGYPRIRAYRATN